MKIKHIVVITTAFAAAIVVLLTVVWLFTAPTYVFSVNGTKIEAEEMQYFMHENRISVATDFENRFNVDSAEEGFWTTELGGETPLEALRRTAAEKLIYDKVQFLAAKENGIKVKLTYSQIAAAQEAENQKRAEMIAAGEPVYGPETVDYHFFYVSQLMEMQTELKEALSKTVLLVTDEEQRTYFDTHPELLVDEEGEPLTLEESRAAITVWVKSEKYDAYVAELVSKAEVTYFDGFEELTVS